MEDGGKLYYSITEVATQFGINASKLRYYEQNFPKTAPATVSIPRPISTI